MLGTILLAGAAAAFSQACDRGQAPSCTQLARMTADGRGVDADPDKGLALATVTCKANHPPACALAKELEAKGANVSSDCP